MNAMIFAAGLGTRLRPLTDSCPKALVKIGGLTLLEMALAKIEKLGVNKVIVNVHHLAPRVVSFIREYRQGKMEIIISDESNLLLDTGGGLLKAAPLFDKGSPVLIFNVDVVTNADIGRLIEYHFQEKNLATLLVQERKASRYLLFDDNKLLRGWQHPGTGEEIWVTTPGIFKAMGFNGVQVINHEMLGLIKHEGSFPLIPVYLELARSGRVGGWSDWDGYWFDAGTPSRVNDISNFLLNCPVHTRQTFL